MAFDASTSGTVYREEYEHPDTVAKLGIMKSFLRIQTVRARTGMGVYVTQRSRFLCQVVEDAAHDQVFQDIGIIAGVKSVTIAEHTRLARDDRRDSRQAGRTRMTPRVYRISFCRIRLHRP